MEVVREKQKRKTILKKIVDKIEDVKFFLVSNLNIKLYINLDERIVIRFYLIYSKSSLVQKPSL